MTAIKLRNSMSREIEPFAPIDPNAVRMYVCGPTVYDRAHLGNARPVVVFDMLYRLLRHVYGPEAVTYVRNFTDVDDKINAKAAETSRSIRDITDETIDWYHADMGELGVLRPNHEPRATEWIGAMIAMIETLIAKGHAYAAEGHALFRVRSFKEYGALSGRSVDDMIAGARVEVAPFKEDPMDFVLWKPSEGDQPGWYSPWGFGRPGWHIECSAMADGLLWEAMKAQLSPAALARPHVFDIHGGGIDLQFPHHENEVAQSCCAHDAPSAASGFANYWLHNEMLLVEGKKMSKSLGNFFTVRDLLDQGIDGEVIRLVFMMTHYAKPMDWTEKKAEEARGRLIAWANMKRQIWGEAPEAAEAVDAGVLEALGDDLNTSLALMRLYELQKRVQALADPVGHEETRRFFATLAFLGFSGAYPNGGVAGDVDRAAIEVTLRALEVRMADLRQAAMLSKDFAGVDALKAALLAAGVEVRMSKAGVELVAGAAVDGTKLAELG